MTLPAVAASRGRELLRASQSALVALPGLVVFTTLVGLAFANGGFFPHAWTAAAVPLLWLVSLGLLLRGRIELGAVERTWLGLIAALGAWTALSASWSLSYGESLLETRRTLVYLAGVGAVLVLATRHSAAYVMAAVWMAGTVVAVYALGRYLLPPRSQPDEFEGNVLFRPLGYANALGIFAGLAAILSVALALRAGSRTLATLAAASIAPLAAAVYLTSSRASALAVVVGLAAMLLVDRERPQLIGALVVLFPAAAAAVLLSARSRLTDSTGVGAEAHRQGRFLCLWIVLLMVALALARPAVEKAGRRIAQLPRRSRDVALAALTAAAIVGAAFVAPAWGRHFFTTGYRTSYWHVAWREYVAHPWLGSGAGTFGDYWLRNGIPGVAGGALDAHNLYLETLAELGPAGLALLTGTLGLPLVAVLMARQHPFASAATGAYVAVVAHAALDWDWEMPVVMLGGLTCAAAVVVAARDGLRVQELRGRLRGAALVLALGLAVFELTAQFVPGLGGGGP